MPILAEGIPRKTADPFDYGGGNITPLGAADPGLVYDIDPRDYTKFFECTIFRTTNVSRPVGGSAAGAVAVVAPGAGSMAPGAVPGLYQRVGVGA